MDLGLHQKKEIRIMTQQTSSLGRRAFLKTSALAGGGLLINFSWLSSLACPKGVKAIADELVTMNGYLKIATNGIVTIMSPNPEGGQNIKTSMPMIVAEELDIDWKKVIVEQAPLNTGLYTRQFIGGSQAIRMGWRNLRMAGATARHMLREAASVAWVVPIEEVTTEIGMLYHKKSGKSANYGEMASAASKLTVPREVKLKDKKEFRIIGKSAKNVDLPNIVTGKAPFGLDTKREGMLIAMIVHPPAFGMKLKSVDDIRARVMPGIKDIFTVKIFNDDYERQFFDTTSFNEVVAVVGKTTWEVMKAKAALKIQWEPFSEYTIQRATGGGAGGGRAQTTTIPAGLENTTSHNAKMAEMMTRPANVVRKDGDPEMAFKNAALIIERTYNGPFLAHNCMEPMNFFAHVTADKVELVGPLQKAELTERALATRLGIPLEKIDDSEEHNV